MKTVIFLIVFSMLPITGAMAGDEPVTLASNKAAIELVQTHADYVWTFATAFVMFKLIEMTVGLRVSPEEEMEGLDVVEHGGNAYPDFATVSHGGLTAAAGYSGAAVKQRAAVANLAGA